MHCPNCGTIIDGPEQRFCTHCGAALESPRPTARKRGRPLAVILIVLIALAAAGTGGWLLLRGREAGQSRRSGDKAWTEMRAMLEELPAPKEIADGDSFAQCEALKSGIGLLTERFLDSDSLLEADQAEESSALVYAWAEYLTEQGAIEGASVADAGSCVAFFLPDTDYLYFPPIRDRWQGGFPSGDKYAVASVTPLNALDAYSAEIYSGGMTAESAAETILSGFEDEYRSSKINTDSVSQLKEFFSQLGEKNIRIIFWRGHGGHYTDRNGNDIVVLMTAEKVSRDGNDAYEGNLNNFGIVPGDGHYCLTPIFFGEYLDNVEGGLFYCGSCFSGRNRSLADVFLAKGFDAFVGADDSIDIRYSDQMMNAAAEYLTEKKPGTKDYLNIIEALSEAKDDLDNGWNHVMKHADMVYALHSDRPVFTALPDKNKLTIRVADREAQPIEFAGISLRNEYGIFRVKEEDDCYTVTLPKGVYQLRISATGYETLEATVQVTGAAELEYQLLPDGAISGTVKDEKTGLPLSDVSIVCDREGGGDRAYGKTDASGNYRIKNLESGSYRLKFSLKGYVDAAGTAVLAPTQQAQLGTKYMTPCGELSVNLVDSETGKPVSGAKVSVSGPGDPLSPEVESDRLGRAVIDNLDPAPYHVLIFCDGYEPKELEGVPVESGKTRLELVELKPLDPYERDRAIYTEYLIESGYREICDRSQWSIDAFAADTNIYTCMTDFDGDGTYELLVKIEDTSGMGVRGYPHVSALLELQDGKPVTVSAADYGGGSMGGRDFEVMYDSRLSGCVPVNSAVYFYNGVASLSYEMDVFHHGDTGWVNDLSLAKVMISTDDPYLAGDVEQIEKGSAPYAYEKHSGSTYICCYWVNDANVSKADYDACARRFTEAGDEAYQYTQTTAKEPIAPKQ